ncbi:MAG: hypothetical protein U5R06_03325 [candidate division KSB1 bacterium]|nr:hypothetical protein [candidate division KSB1 bacterium]
MWVTMTPDGPQNAVITLDGILGDNIVTEKTYPVVTALRNENWFRIKPVVHPGEYFKKLNTSLSLINRAEPPMHITGTFERSDLEYEPGYVDTTVAAQEQIDIPITLAAENPVSIRDLQDHLPVVQLKAAYFETSKNPISLSASRKLLIDWRHSCDFRPDLRPPNALSGCAVAERRGF